MDIALKTAVPFVKMNGCGNDFIVIDNRRGIVGGRDVPEWVRRVCHRRHALGADGLILVEPSSSADFKWQFFNADGSRAEMCGNGARCVARFAFMTGIAGEQMAFDTDAGRIEAAVSGRRVRVRMTDPSGLALDRPVVLTGGARPVSVIDTGVPHAVVAVDRVDAVDVASLGREIRYHPDFAPAGTNANFIHRGADGVVHLRTYERGVEAETLACGTGAVAAALVTAAKDDAAVSPIAVRTQGDCTLHIHFERTAEGFGRVYMEGETRLVGRGELLEEAWR